MKRITPSRKLEGVPCSLVAVACALGVDEPPTKARPKLKNGGYASLDEMNKYVRANLAVRKRVNFKRGNRPLLRELKPDTGAVVCVRGHFLYHDGRDYHSFLWNGGDEVVSVWYLEG